MSRDDLLSRIVETVRQVFTYLVIGTFTTGLYWVLCWLLLQVEVDYRIAVGVGYGIGSLLNYGLQKWLTFKDHGLRGEGLKMLVYWVLVGISLAMSVGLTWLGVETLGLPEMASVVATSFVVVVFNFASHKYITFNAALWGGPEARALPGADAVGASPAESR
jgi:putative flippase GtrA